MEDLPIIDSRLSLGKTVLNRLVENIKIESKVKSYYNIPFLPIYKKGVLAIAA
jgi:hypothetical protein